MTIDTGKRQLISLLSKKSARTRPIQGKKIGETEWVDYTGATEAARVLNLHSSTITMVCQGKRHPAKGYVFRYKDFEIVTSIGPNTHLHFFKSLVYFSILFKYCYISSNLFRLLEIFLFLIFCVPSFKLDLPI